MLVEKQKEIKDKKLKGWKKAKETTQSHYTQQTHISNTLEISMIPHIKTM